MTTTIQKTDTSRSPLLVPVINRNYTKGLGESQGPKPAPEAGQVNPPQPPEPGQNQPNFQKPLVEEPPHSGPTPGDTTKEFSFNEETDNVSDLKDGETGPGLNIPTGSARTFANTIGNLVQIYLPRAAYGYAKIDMQNVIVNIEKHILTSNWLDTFEKINENTEKALQIPDESIKMWKAAFQHWLEYQKIEAANPNTEFIIASGAILTEMGIRVYTCRKENEGYMKQAIEHCNPDMAERKMNMEAEPTKTEENERKRAA